MLQMNNEVTPRAIAYSVVVVRLVACWVLQMLTGLSKLLFNLSSAGPWGSNDEDMDYHSLYNFIIDYFEAVGSRHCLLGGIST